MGFPTPKGHGETETDTDNKPPTFGDSLSVPELKQAIQDYAEWCVENYQALSEVDLSDVSIEISKKAKRAAGKAGCKRRVGDEPREMFMRFAWRAYQKWGWSEEWEKTIRHELVHVWQYQITGDGDHGAGFKRKATQVDVAVHCPRFSDFKYELYCTGCGDFAGGRHKRSKVVKHPGKYRSRCCGAELRSERA